MKVEAQKIVELLPGLEADSKERFKYQLIYNVLKKAILGGDLPDKCELPPTRSLADTLRISRSTIIKVYDLLKLEGLLDGTPGSGHVVNFPGNLLMDETALPSNDNLYVHLSDAAIAFHQNLKLINSIDDPGIAFRPGIPPLDLFPVSKWKKLSNEYWQFVRASELSYYAGEGVEALRKTIANYLNLRRNVKCHYKQVFVVSGSLQSLYLIGSLLVNPGDEILVENPTFPNVHSVFKGLRARVTGVEPDALGMDAHKLKERISPHSKLVHITPSCHYPLGMQMPQSRKEELLALAGNHGLYIIENDYENEVNYPNHDGRPIFTSDKQDRTFYLGTFNRLVHPSIRVGFVVVPRHLEQNFNAMVLHSHRFVAPSVQMVLRNFIEKKFLQEHLKNVAHEASIRHDKFAALLQKYLPTQFENVEMQCPSLHHTVLLKNGRMDVEAVSKLAQNGIIAHSLSKCYVQPTQIQGLIFGYAAIKPQHMESIVKRMAKALTG